MLVTDAQAALASIVQSSEDAILSTSPDGRIVSWNRGAEALYGYSEQEILGQPLSMLVPAEDQALMRHRRELLLCGESIPPFDGTVIRKDGSRIVTSVRPFLIRNGVGQVVGEGAIVRDVSLRRHAEQAQAMLASIVESSNVGIFSTSLDGTILTWNKGAEAIWGYGPEQILGKSISILASPEHHRDQMQVLERSRQGDNSEFESPTVRRDGRSIETAMSVSPVRNCAREVVATSTIARDISARKHAEEALRQSEERYRSLVVNIPDVNVMAYLAVRPGHTETAQQLFGRIGNNWDESVWRSKALFDASRTGQPVGGVKPLRADRPRTDISSAND